MPEPAAMAEPTVLLLHGTDEFKIAREVEAHIRQLGDPTTAGMNTTRLDARSMTEDELNNAVNAMPFLAARRLVILEGVTARYGVASQRKRFLAFLQSLPATALVLIVEQEELDKNKDKDKKPSQGTDRKKKDESAGDSDSLAEKGGKWLLTWVKANGARAAEKPFPQFRQKDMAAWIIDEARAQGGKIEPAAAARLAEMTGVDTRQAAQEITKLLTYVNFRHPIEMADVDAASIVSAQANVFEMVDALGGNDPRKAQRLLHSLLEEEDPLSLFGMVVRQFRLLLLAREALDGGARPEDLAGRLRLHPFVAGKIAAQARNFRIEQLEAVYQRLDQIDEEAKSHRVPLETGLEMFVAEWGRRR